MTDSANNGRQYDVVAFGAHPDDVEYGMGATLLRLVRDGLKTLVVHATQGENGTHGNGDLRVREARAAAEFAGADVRFLDFEDMNIRDTQEARRTVARVIREARPRMVFAPYYDYPHKHPDHEEMGRIVRAVTRLTRIRNFVPDVEPHTVKHYFYYILPPHVRPTFVLDVTEQMADWDRLAGSYASQFEGMKGVRELLLQFRRHFGSLIGCPYAEGFYSDQPLDLTPIDLSQLGQSGEATVHH